MNGAGDSHDRAAAQLLMQGTFGPNRSYGDAFDIVDDFLSRIHPSINQSFRIYHLTLVVRYPNSVPMGADFVPFLDTSFSKFPLLRACRGNQSNL